MPRILRGTIVSHARSGSFAGLVKSGEESKDGTELVDSSLPLTLQASFHLHLPSCSTSFYSPLSPSLCWKELTPPFPSFPPSPPEKVRLARSGETTIAELTLPVDRHLLHLPHASVLQRHRAGQGALSGQGERARRVWLHGSQLLRRTTVYCASSECYAYAGCRRSGRAAALLCREPVPRLRRRRNAADTLSRSLPTLSKPCANTPSGSTISESFKGRVQAVEVALGPKDRL